MTAQRVFDFAKLYRTALAGAALVGALLLASQLIDVVLRQHVAASIKRNAEEKAISWGERFIAQLPSIDEIIATGRATDEQAQRIRDSLAVGEVFRFKLFAPNGDLTFVSDERRFLREGGAAHNAKAFAVFQSGESDVSVHDGRAKPNRPNTYVEAYIPAVAPDGTNIGVIEVYVDATAIEHVLMGSFTELSFWLIICCAVVFLTPAVAYALRGRQLQLRDRRVVELQKYDQLTGVLNRNALSHEIDRLFEERKANELLGLLFIDVDRFKQVNDTHGHEHGDALLRFVAQTLRSSVREGRDMVGRFGGDEFVVLCRSVDRRQLQEIVLRIQSAVDRTHRREDLKTIPTLSIGAHLSQPGEDSRAALQAADIALYEAKRGGRNKMVEYTEELDAARVRTCYVENLLRRAIDDDLLVLNFQPICETKNRSPLGFEALLRLRDPRAGHVPPAEFISLAEELKLMDEIGAWVLRRAIEAALPWPDELFVSINLTPAQFRSGTLPELVADALERYDFSPERLELEVTEAILSEEGDSVRNQLRDLKKLGVSIAVDDFCAGNSSIGHFWKFDIDKLKLDRGFMIAHDHDVKLYSRLLKAITSFSDAMGLVVVAEGVESENQLAVNAAAGVEQAQGFLLGHPMNADDAKAYIANCGELEMRTA